MLRRNIEPYRNIETIHGALVVKKRTNIQLNDRGTCEVGFSVVEQPEDCKSPIAIQEVPAFTLASLVREFSDIGILKLDIKGGELEILQGDPELAKIPVVFAELHDRIVPGCTDAFFQFSRERIVVNGNGEKYLSVSKDILRLFWVRSD